MTEKQKPDYANMSGKELVEAHNALTGGNRKAPFDSKADAIRRCEKLWAEQNPVVVQPATTIAASKGGKKKSEAAAPKSSGKTPAPEKKQEAKEPRASLQRVIAVSPDKDPPREGTTTRQYYDTMSGGLTVGDYLDKHEDRRRASQELRNVVRAGRVSLLG